MSPLIKLGLKLVFQKATVEAYAKHGVKPSMAAASKPKVSALIAFVMAGIMFGADYLSEKGTISPETKERIETMVGAPEAIYLLESAEHYLESE